MSKLAGKKYSGDLYARAYGSNGPFEKMGNVSGLKTSREVETDTLPSTGKYDYGEAISVEVKPGETEIEISFNSFDKNGLARALMGAAVDTASQKESVDKVEYTVPKSGWLKLAHEDIDVETLELFDEHDSPVDKSTYDAKGLMGMLQFNRKSSFVGGETIKISYTQKGSKGFTIDANTLQKIELELRLDGRDRISGKQGLLWIPHAVLASDGDLDWFSDDWWENGMKGTLVKEADKPTMRFNEYED